MLRAGVIFLAIIAVLLTGCQQAASKAVEQTTGVKVDSNENSVTIKNDKGEEVNISSQTPEELKNFPVPDGFKLDSSGSMTQSGDKLSVGSWVGKAAINDVAAYYEKVMPAQGWKKTASMSPGDTAFYTFEKDDKSVIISADKKDSDTEISVLLGTNKSTPTSGLSTSTK